ncbi:MAG: ABC transporter ATP-binding protein [Bacteroidia bacterium]|nr:ABC transporter ATP-binding protein [Bacteroidia bacterium]
MESVLSAQALTKSYPRGTDTLTVLHPISFELHRGTSSAIVGPSGSGKTTLLGLCAGLDRPTAGSITLLGHRLETLNEDARAAVRNRHVGFVFQNFQLIPTLTALENVLLPLELRGQRGGRPTALALLERVGLAQRHDHYPLQLSGGEQQRVALARAFVANPDILFADEPTGNLDGTTRERVTELLFELNQTQGTTLVLVTHDLELAQRTQRVFQLKNGHLVHDSQPQPTPLAH